MISIEMRIKGTILNMYHWKQAPDSLFQLHICVERLNLIEFNHLQGNMTLMTSFLEKCVCVVHEMTYASILSESQACRLVINWRQFFGEYGFPLSLLASTTNLQSKLKSIFSFPWIIWNLSVVYNLDPSSKMFSAHRWALSLLALISFL